MSTLRAVYREADVPAVIAEHLAIHLRMAHALLARHGHPQSFRLKGASYVTGDEIRSFLAKAAGSGKA